MFEWLGRAASLVHRTVTGPGEPARLTAGALQARRVPSSLLPLLSLFFLLIASSCLRAQAPVDGAIRGVAIDQAAAAIAGATIAAEDVGHGLRFTTLCDAAGGFFLPHLPVGVYTATISAPGFSSLVLDEIRVEAGGTASLAVRLKIAGAHETVTVSADVEDGIATVDQPAGAAISSVVGTAELDQLPVNGRQWQSFALLTPAANAADAGDDLARVSFRGLPVTQNSSSLDGIDDDNSFHAVPRGAGSAESSEGEDISDETGSESGGARRSSPSWRRSGAAYSFSQAAVREFRVSTQNYTALYGHGVGGAIATISKSGTNDLHGTVFYMGRTSAWNAANPFSVETHYRNGAVTSATVKPHDLRHQFGATVGGPAVRDRLFYFYAFDQQRRGFPAISSPADANFYALTATQKALLANRGVTATKINTALNYLDGLTGKADRRDDQTINFIKLDGAFTERSRASAQYNRLRSSVPAGLRGAPVVDRGVRSLGNGTTNADTFSSRWTWIASARLLNEARVAWGHELRYEQPQTPLPQEPAIGPGGLAPEISIGPNGFAFGTPAGVGRSAYPDETRFEFVDTATWGTRRHLVQAGFDFSRTHDRVSALDNSVGTFHYDSGTTNGRAGGLVDWVTDYTFNVNAYPNGGCPSINAAVHLFCFRSYTQSFGEQAVEWTTQDWAGFVEESWRPRADLAIHAGLRYEYELLPLPQRPNGALDAVFGITAAGASNIGATSIFPEDRNNFGPRIGLAWSPSRARGFVVRAGYGVFYGRVPGGTVRAALANTALSSSTTHIQITPNTVTNCPQVANQGFGYVCSYVAAPPNVVATTTAATIFSRRFRTPLVQQGSLAVERGIGASIIASASYLMNIDRQLQGSVDINVAPSTTMKTFQLQGGTGAEGVRDGETFALPVYTARVNDSFGPVTAITSNINASYNAFALEARRRSRAGLEFRASWTWSKAIDDGANTTAAPRTNAQLDPFTVQYDKGLSRLNFPHKVVVSAVWQPRLSATQRWLSLAANGWTISGIVHETSGRPYSYEIFGGTRLGGGRESINGSGGAVYLPTVGRNTLRLPDTSRVDLRIVRSVHVGERVRLRAMAEAFNLFNHVNYTGIQQRAFLVGTPVASVTPLIFQDAATVAAEGLNVRPFGAYTASGTGEANARQLELGLHLEF